MSSLLRIFPEADFGTLFIKVTLRNLLNGATCKGQRNRSKLKERDPSTIQLVQKRHAFQEHSVNRYMSIYSTNTIFAL